MRLLRLKVEQLRRFRQPVEIRDLDAGINLFTGPNESGKSTLVRAIRAAFFERYKSSSVEDLQPWGDSAAAPTVELEFEWQGKRWKLVKSFLKRKRCDVSVDGVAFSGEEAEEKLADLLGFEFPGRGASRPEHWGIPGLLWIEQGAGHEIHKPVEHAGSHLKSVLGSSLGEVTSSAGDALIARITKERARLLTATGRPTGDFATALEAHERLEREHADLQGRIRQYRQQVDRLGQLRDEQARDDGERIWEAYRQQARAAEVRLAEVLAWQREQERDQQALQVCQASVRTSLDLLGRFEAQRKDLHKRAADRDVAAQALAAQEARRPAVERALADARAAFEAARVAVRLAREQQQRKDLARELEQADAELAGLDQALARARELHEALLRQRGLRQSLHIDAKALARLRKAEDELARLAIRQEAVATRLQFDLREPGAVTLAGEPLHGQGERLLLEPAEIVLGPLGSLRILPGGDDIADLVRKRQGLEDDRASLLSVLGVASLAAADARHEHCRELDGAIRRDESVLESLAPEGLEALAGRRQLKEARREELARLIAALPEPQQGGLSVSRAEAQLDGAGESLKAAEAAEAGFRSALLLATQALESARSEWSRLDGELQGADRRQHEMLAAEQLLELRANENRLEQALRERQKQIDLANPGVLRQDVERFTRSADAAEKAAEQRRLELERLKASLEALGAEGLEERSAELDVELARAVRRKDELGHRAGALDLLLVRLTDHRLQLTRQLQAPLQRHLNRYLQLLFPEASLSVDEALVPEILVRQGLDGEERGRFAELSFGAREQMGLISRLAYADLLREAGRPTLIILDDALVHSDVERLGNMKRVLFDAAQRHQILLFSCHPDSWRDLGVAPRDVAGLGMPAAPSP